MALLAVNSLLLCAKFENRPVSHEKEQFIARLTDICALLKYPERGRQTQLAQRYKLAQPSVRKWFTGQAMPSYEIASDLCKRAMVNYEWLMTGRLPKYYSADQILDPDLRRGLEILTAMEPGERPKAIRMLDLLAEPKKNGTDEKH
jgi:transcriptional regulator with XRE-family HTH domain